MLCCMLSLQEELVYKLSHISHITLVNLCWELGLVSLVSYSLCTMNYFTNYYLCLFKLHTEINFISIPPPCPLSQSPLCDVINIMSVKWPFLTNSWEQEITVHSTNQGSFPIYVPARSLSMNEDVTDKNRISLDKILLREMGQAIMDCLFQD